MSAGPWRWSIQCGGRPVTVSTPRTNSSLKSRRPATISFMCDGEKVIIRASRDAPPADPVSTFRFACHT
jgi:hypothetical protein